MSQENVEIALRATDAIFARDVEAWVECFDKSAEFLLPRNVIEGGSYRGHDGLRRAFTDVFETWDDIRFAREATKDRDDLVVVLGRTTNVGKGEAPTIEYESAYLYKVCAGKIVYFRPYQSQLEALEAVGLAE